MKSFDDYREERNRVPQREFADLKERQFARSVQEPLPEEAMYYDELINQELYQEEIGIFGVGIRNTTGTLIPFLDMYLNPITREEVRQHNEDTGDTMTYINDTATRTGLDDLQVEAAVCYYFSHQQEFDAYFLVQRAMMQRDPRIDHDE